MKQEEAAYASKMFEFLDLELTALREWILSGRADVRKLGDPNGGIFRHRGMLKARLLEIVMRVRNFGVTQVADEMARQPIKG